MGSASRKLFKFAFVPLCFALGILNSSFATDAEQPNNLPSPLSEADFHEFNPQAALLGRALFYDPVVSGNKNISCATCHHPDLGTSDGLALGVGEGGQGLGMDRTVGDGNEIIRRRVPRNAQALFNLGAREFRAVFHDGRVEIDPNDPSGFDTPADEDTPLGLNNLLAAQALFPLTSDVEMAGYGGENDISTALEDIYGNPWLEVWRLVEERLQANEAYFNLFQAAYPNIRSSEDISIVHYANAISDFVNSEWRSVASPFDRYLQGDVSALSEQQKAGLDLFYGKAGCATCHSGSLLTDHAFHAIAMPQIGPGKVARLEAFRHDRGRALATNRIEDRYKFRTPSLRNVALTAPYGHAGVYNDLESIVRHHLDPVESFNRFSYRSVELPHHPKLSREDGFIMQDRRERRRIIKANVLKPTHLSDGEVNALIAFLHSLTDEQSAKGRLGVPEFVPSGLAVDRIN